MKHHAPGRPIGKCKGCCLNMRTFCAANLEPKAQWSKRRCKSRNDQSLLEAYLNPPAASGAKAAKLSRRTKAAHMNTVPHFDGQVFAPARRGANAPRRG
jgi:hypothetical protein